MEPELREAILTMARDTAEAAYARTSALDQATTLIDQGTVLIAQRDLELAEYIMEHLS